MNAMQLFTGPLAQAIGWALLHLLWQATIVAAILAAVLSLIPRQSATARYAAACKALGLVFAMFVATAWRSFDPAVAPVPLAASPATADQPARINLAQVPVVIVSIAAESWRDRALDAVARAQQSLPSIVAVWLAGVVFLSSRLLIGWLRARRLAWNGAAEAGAEWQRVATRLSDALGLRRVVRLLESAAVEVPSVIGTFRPVILLPASTLTGLTPEQIEMVLAHELAHIRRHDFLVNLLQAVVETLMFYHPAVWWISRRVRVERENCCDDLAVAVCGNPIQYARALTRLEELRSAPSLLVAANGGSLLDRVRRIAGVRAESNALSARWVAAMITLVVLAIGLSVPSLPAFADREDKPVKEPKAAKVEKSESQVEVTAPAEPGTPVAMADDDEAGVDVEGEDADDESEMPGVPEVAVMAPEATPMPATVPMPAGTAAPAPVARVAPPRTPRPGRAPVAIAGMSAPDFDFDFEDDQDDEKGNATPIGSGKLTVDELISLKAVGVTPDYIDQMRALFGGNLTVHEVTGLRALDVTPAFVREMRDAGITVDSARTAKGLRALGVSAEYVRALRAAGVDVKSAKEAQSLKATGVTVEFVRQLSAAGYTNLSAKELSRMAAVGIDEEFIRDMAKYRDKK
jgi:beta-lactamase regulating signal transducer with metallopeptidase domain